MGDDGIVLQDLLGARWTTLGAWLVGWCKPIIPVNGKLKKIMSYWLERVLQPKV